jgi:glucose/arabinose dehydrogenase
VAKVPQAVDMAVRTGDPALYIVSKSGRVFALRAGALDHTPSLDLSGQVSGDSEQGLLGLAFSPDGRFGYVDYTDRTGDTNVVEYAWKDGRAVLSTRRRVLFVRQPYPNHNGGDLVFGPDGDLYIGLGDGGSGGAPDPNGNGQNLGVLLGKMLRIEPRLPNGSLPPGGAPYAIPQDNPFVDRTGARPEIWAYGLRNPWRYSFDRGTGDLWIGDVGLGTYEEVDEQAASSTGGQNYGWSDMEGTSVLHAPPPPRAVGPVFEYSHLAGGGCAIVGGFVYRGHDLPGLDGWYVFGDFCTSDIDAIHAEGAPEETPLGPHVAQLASFGEDAQGELYALSLAGGVYRFVP